MASISIGGQNKLKAEDLQKNIYNILKIRFGIDGMACFERIKEVKNVAILKSIHTSLIQAQSFADAKAVIDKKLSW